VNISHRLQFVVHHIIRVKLQWTAVFLTLGLLRRLGMCVPLLLRNYRQQGRRMLSIVKNRVRGGNKPAP
jgi:hypothetical protein